MPKKLKELLDAINSKKTEVINLTNEKKFDDAEKAKAELINLQKQFDLIQDVVDPDVPAPEPTPEPTPAPKDTHVVGAKDKDAVHEFADAARHGFYNADTPNKEGTGLNGGYTVPADILTRINQFKEDEFNLSKFADSENVTTNSGRRTYQSRADLAGFSLVGEGAKIAQAAGPQFQILEYAIKKYAGFFPVTNELLADSDANITSVLTQWIARQDVATRNNLILNLLKGITPTALSGYKDIKKAIIATLGSKYNDIAIYTNDDGVNYIDTEFVDGNGRSLLVNDLQTSLGMRFAAGGRLIPIRQIPNTILASDSKTTSGSTIIPVFIGSMKEFVKVFDRQKLTILSSNTAQAGNFNAYDQDMMLFRAIDRLDVVKKDEQSMVYGQITVKDSTAAGK